MFALGSEADEILFARHFRLTPKSEPKWDRILDCIDENGGGPGVRLRKRQRKKD
jgi:hypothetical protein